MTLSERYKNVCDSMDIEFASRRETLDEAVRRLIDCVDGAGARYEDAEIRNPNATPLMKGMTLGIYRQFKAVLADLESAIAKMEGEV